MPSTCHCCTAAGSTPSIHVHSPHSPCPPRLHTLHMPLHGLHAHPPRPPSMGSHYYSMSHFLAEGGTLNPNRETPPRSHPNVGNTCRGTAPLLCSTYRAVTLLERGCPCCLRAVHMGQHRHRPPPHARLPAGGVRVLRSMDRSIGRTNEAAGQASKRAALIEAAPHFEQGVRGGGFSSVGRALD